MIYRKTILLPVLATLFVVFTAAILTPPGKFKNLQVLPQDISQPQLDSFMNVYCQALKVNCDFCHTPAKDIFGLTPPNGELVFSLDNPMKENARKMIRMTIAINTNNFNYDSLVKPLYLKTVTCNTCHRGNPFPANE